MKYLMFKQKLLFFFFKLRFSIIYFNLFIKILIELEFFIFFILHRYGMNLENNLDYNFIHTILLYAIGL